MIPGMCCHLHISNLIVCSFLPKRWCMSLPLLIVGPFNSNLGVSFAPNSSPVSNQQLHKIECCNWILTVSPYCKHRTTLLQGISSNNSLVSYGGTSQAGPSHMPWCKPIWLLQSGIGYKMESSFCKSQLVEDTARLSNKGLCYSLLPFNKNWASPVCRCSNKRRKL